MENERIKVLNIKSDYLSAEEATSKVLTELNALKLNKQVKVLLVIHGYGSSGKGGTIKKELQLLLPTLKTQNKIKDFIANEKFFGHNSKYVYYTKLYPELILNKNLNNLNPGITLIFLN